MAELRLIDKKIVLISPEPWGDNFLSKHHIATELAHRNNQIFFISPPGLHDNKTEYKLPKNINIINYAPVRGLNRLPRYAARWFARFEVNRILRQTGPVDIVWSFDPYRFQFLGLFQASITIYHAVDNHQTSLEKRIVNEADIFFSNAQFTLDKYHRLNKYKIGHGVASYFFSQPCDLELPGPGTIKIGYVGNLEHKLLNFRLLKQVVINNPKVNFYFVGPRGRSNLNPLEKNVFDWSELDLIENVYWLGEQPSSKIPAYLNKFDVLLLLYNPDSNGFVVNAHKILEYLSSGKVIVSKAQDDYQQYPGLLVTGKTDQEIMDMFSRVISNLDYFNSDDLKQRRTNWAKSNTYEKQIDKVEMILRTFVDNE